MTRESCRMHPQGAIAGRTAPPPERRGRQDLSLEAEERPESGSGWWEIPWMPRPQRPPARRQPRRGLAPLRWPACCRPTWPHNPRACRRTHGRANPSRLRGASPSGDAHQRGARHRPALRRCWPRRGAPRPNASSGASWPPPGCSGRAAPRARASGCGGRVTSGGVGGGGIMPHVNDTRRRADRYQQHRKWRRKGFPGGERRDPPMGDVRQLDARGR